MARNDVRLDHKGIEEVATGLVMRRAMAIKTEQVARAVQRMGIKVGGFKGASGEIDLPVKVEHDVTDRARGRVILAHPAGQAVQAKHGALTKAAAQSGLDVKDEGR